MIFIKMTTSKMSESSTKKSSSMADLPNDVIRLIGSCLLGRDRACFRGVCKALKSVISSAPPPTVQLIKSLTSLETIDQFPLLMFSGCDGGSLCSFYHPIYNTTYILDYSLEIAANAIIRFSKDGWLLISRGDREMFFFNPVTKKIIDLPNLPDDYNFTGICFSSLPTSRDCIVFGLNSSFLGFICRGEDAWNRWEDPDGYNLSTFPFYNNPVFYNGIFYFLDGKGNLGTFDPKQGIEHGWTFLAKLESPCNSIRRNYLAELNGELISVFEGHVGKWIKIFKLNSRVMAWRRVDSLGDNMLFVSRTSSLSATTSSNPKQVLGMENKIYFPRFYGKNCVFYSLHTRRYHTFETGYCSDDYYGTTLKMDCAWFQPSFDVQSDDEEFHW